MSEDRASAVVRKLMEEYVSENKSGDYELHLVGDDWRRFCAELEQAIREEFPAA